MHMSLYGIIKSWLLSDLRRATTEACRPLLPVPAPSPGVSAAARETPAAPPASGGGAPRQSPPPAAPVTESGQQPACPERGESLNKAHSQSIMKKIFEAFLYLGRTALIATLFAARSPIRSSQPASDPAVPDGAASPRQRVEVRGRGRRRRGTAASAAAASPAPAPVLLLLLGIAV